MTISTSYQRRETVDAVECMPLTLKSALVFRQADCLDGVKAGGPDTSDALKLNPKTLKSRARVQLLAKET
eukprot:6597783-Pyramimonas_sp.AAC.1